MRWVKLDADLVNSPVFAKDGLWRVYSYCLMSAGYKTKSVPFKIRKTVEMVDIGPMQFIFGRKSAAKILNISPSTLWKRMKRLESLGYVLIDSSSGCSIITVKNTAVHAEKGDTIRDTIRDTNRPPKGDTKEHHETEEITRTYSLDDEKGNTKEDTKGDTIRDTKRDTTKNNRIIDIKKKKYQKEKSERAEMKKSTDDITLDEYLDYARELSLEHDVTEFDEHIELFIRQRMEKPKAKRYQSKLGIKTLFNNLIGCRDLGYDIAECIEVASGNGWQVPNPSYFDNQYLKTRPKPLNGTENIPQPKTYAQLQHQDKQMQLELRKHLERELYGGKNEGSRTVN